MVRLKVLSGAAGKKLGLTFQFLMVRLKGVPILQRRYGWDIISIPYGAIKRKEQLATSLALRNFNSLWCD